EVVVEEKSGTKLIEAVIDPQPFTGPPCVTRPPGFEHLKYIAERIGYIERVLDRSPIKHPVEATQERFRHAREVEIKQVRRALEIGHVDAFDSVEAEALKEGGI